VVEPYGAKGLAWIKYENGEHSGAPVKFFTTEQLMALNERLGMKDGDTMMFLADKPRVVNAGLAALRNDLGKRLELYNKDEFNLVWITEFPLLEWNDDENRWESSHHPFTSVHEDDMELFLNEPLTKESKLGGVRSSSYDLVLNGVELASGSVRIHDSKVQKRVFEILGISDEMAKERFGFFTEALSYGTPPHAGIAPGIDRLVAMMLGYENIREVIAFPKTARAICPMSEAPGTVEAKQMRELGLKFAE
ncbi:MAG: aspartate--tRNA ligase, partial [Planctomycetes bacterium]|nr:aspartate--tRNA ligase [Planctomycetota bacterium]